MKSNIRTSSLIRMWYLRFWCGHRLQCKVMTPVLMIGGTVLYASQWILRAA